MKRRTVMYTIAQQLEKYNKILKKKYLNGRGFNNDQFVA